MGWHRHFSTRAHSYALPLLVSMPLILSSGSMPVDGAALGSAARTSRVADGALTAESPSGLEGSEAGRFGLPGERGRPSTVKVISPKGLRIVSESAPGVHDIPATASRAYQRASAVLAEVDPGCQLPWTLVAAIGRVESDHGRYAGAVLNTDGVSSPPIIGVPLNGAGDVAAIPDSDGGVWDGDTVWDRAVGPMQFIPTTWDAAGVDGDGDGLRNPNDIDDAALAAAVYLCAGADHLLQPRNMRSAILRYNNSSSYASLVMAYERSYRTGDFTILGPELSTPGLASVTPSRVAHLARSAAPALKKVDDGRSPQATDKPKSGRGKQSPSARPSPTKSPDSGPSKGPSPTPGGNPSPSPKPGSGSSGSPSPDPGTTPPTEPPPDPEPVLVTESGVWSSCAEGFCLDGNVLLLGSAEQLAAAAAADYDADGTTETNADEFAGLAESTATVTLEVEKQTDGWVVHTINDQAYPVDTSAPSPPA